MEDQKAEQKKRKEQQEWEKHHYGTVARWVKEVALLALASLVVQRFLTRGVLDDPVLLLGIGTTAILYAAAINLLLKS
jgi:hypothetical protein